MFAFNRNISYPFFLTIAKTTAIMPMGNAPRQHTIDTINTNSGAPILNGILISENYFRLMVFPLWGC